MSPPHRPPPRSVTPKDAASLVLVRGHGARAEVLMGRRRARTSFLPGIYVFPGGRVDPEDAYLPRGLGLRPEVVRKVRRRCVSTAPDTLAMTVIRETYEETGLLLCDPARDTARESMPDTPIWRAYAKAGATPALHALDYVARAITPARSPKRFNTRFFVADAGCVQGSLIGDGELLDLHWVPMADAVARLNVVDVTAFVLAEVAAHLAAPLADRDRRRVPLLCYVDNRGRIIHE